MANRVTSGAVSAGPMLSPNGFARLLRNWAANLPGLASDLWKVAKTRLARWESHQVTARDDRDSVAMVRHEVNAIGARQKWETDTPSMPEGITTTTTEELAPAATQSEPTESYPPNIPSEDSQKVDKQTAYQGFRDTVVRASPHTGEDSLRKHFAEICRDLIGKPEDQFTESDWIKIRDEGPNKFVPF